jgi:hypothetical protein
MLNFSSSTIVVSSDVNQPFGVSEVDAQATNKVDISNERKLFFMVVLVNITRLWNFYF